MGERTAAFHLKAAPTPATVPVTVLPPPIPPFPVEGSWPQTQPETIQKRQIFIEISKLRFFEPQPMVGSPPSLSPHPHPLATARGMENGKPRGPLPGAGCLDVW